ncbi:uncharacterized protein [Diadema setosum]|uniref:uncharacterized protein n=1 Tax=Diadema setosum TaxID=31175 RepID=UPI003B3BA198
MVHLFSPAQSCQGRCGNFSGNAQCQCHSQCLSSRNCCPDFWSTCVHARLVDGDSPNEGRVELVLESESFGTICPDGWSIMDATVLCNQLGYPGASLRTVGEAFGSGDLPALVSAFLCNGGEHKVTDCNFTVLQGNCPENGAAGVICQKPGYQGCFGRPSSSLLLREHHLSDPAMTGDLCIQHCAAGKYELAAVRGVDCTCGLGIPIDSNYYHDYRCRMPCPGDPRQICGGYTEGRLMVYKTNSGFCRHPGNPSNGQRHGDYFRFGSRVKYTCDSGYALIGSDEIQCIPRDKWERPITSTTWSAIAPVCIGGTVVDVVVGLVVVAFIVVAVVVILFIWRLRRKRALDKNNIARSPREDSATNEYNSPVSGTTKAPIPERAKLQTRAQRDDTVDIESSERNQPSDGKNFNSNKCLEQQGSEMSHEYFTRNELILPEHTYHGSTDVFYSTKIEKKYMH